MPHEDNHNLKEALGSFGAPKTPGRVSWGRGNLIMELSEKFIPWLMKMAEGVRNDDGTPVQPAHVRSVALNLAQHVVKEQQNG